MNDSSNRKLERANASKFSATLGRRISPLPVSRPNYSRRSRRELTRRRIGGAAREGTATRGDAREPR